MYLFFQKTVYRFLYFLRTPDDHSFARVGFSFKINTLASLLLLNVVFASIWMVVIHVFGKEGLVNLNDELFKMPIWEMMLLGVVIIPFTEEIMFRFPIQPKLPAAVSHRHGRLVCTCQIQNCHLQ